jgi:hypothetical protein
MCGNVNCMLNDMLSTVTLVFNTRFRLFNRLYSFFSNTFGGYDGLYESYDWSFGKLRDAIVSTSCLPKPHNSRMIGSILCKFSASHATTNSLKSHDQTTSILPLTFHVFLSAVSIHIVILPVKAQVLCRSSSETSCVLLGTDDALGWVYLDTIRV